VNREAERHLDKAGKLIGKGSDAYLKAAAEILAARDADPRLSIKDAGEKLGRTGGWVKKLLAWAANPETDTPFAEPHREPRDIRGARAVLADAPLEQVEKIIGDLPFERQQAIAAATGDRYAKVRQEADERERRMTPAQHKERDAAVETVRQGAAEMMAGVDALAIVNDLEHATELLKAMVEKSVLSHEGMRRIDTALGAFLDEYRVAQAMVGEEART
jgi:hypothetical protein